MNIKVIYDGGLNVDLDNALEDCLLKFGLRRWASGMDLITKERDLAFDDLAFDGKEREP